MKIKMMMQQIILTHMPGMPNTVEDKNGTQPACKGITRNASESEGSWFSDDQRHRGRIETPKQTLSSNPASSSQAEPALPWNRTV